jgi:hypothetical protein
VGDKQNRLFHGGCIAIFIRLDADHSSIRIPISSFSDLCEPTEECLPFATSQLEVFDKCQSRIVVQTDQEGQAGFRLCTWLPQAQVMPKEEFKQEVERELTERETEPWEIFARV